VVACRAGTYEQEQELHAGAKQWRHRGDWYNDCPELRRYCDAFFFSDREIISEPLPEVASERSFKPLHYQEGM
jgi:hypothetical protein